MDNEITNKIIDLYKLGKSCKEVAEELNITRISVWRYLKKIGIQLRNASECKIGKKHTQEHNDKISQSTKGKYKGEFRYNYKKLKEGYNNPTPELSYILGVLYGDGYIPTRRNDQIGLQSIDKDFIDEFNNCLKLQFGYDAAIYNQKPRLIQFKGQKQYMQSPSFLLMFISVTAKEFIESVKNWDYIFKLSDEHKKSFIRGLWDSEGTIGTKDNRWCQIKFRSSNKDLAEKYQKLLLEVLNINSHINISKTNMYDVNFAKTTDVIKFYKEIKPTIKRKKEIIERVLKCNPN